MPDYTFGGNAGTGNTEGWVRSSRTLTARTAANGKKPFGVRQLKAYTGGYSGSVEIKIKFAGATATFDDGAGSAADTGWRTVSSVKYKDDVFEGNFQIEGSARFYFGRNATSGGSTVTGAYGTWAGGPIGGGIRYIEVPTAPRNLNLTPGTGSLAVAWTAPEDDGDSAITGYRVFYATNSGFTGAASVDVTGTSTTLSGLIPNQTYYVRVGALNAVATEAGTTSPYSSTQSATTLGGIYYGVGGTWKDAQLYYGVNGTWKLVDPRYGVSGTWKVPSA